MKEQDTHITVFRMKPHPVYMGNVDTTLYLRFYGQDDYGDVIYWLPDGTPDRGYQDYPALSETQVQEALSRNPELVNRWQQYYLNASRGLIDHAGSIEYEDVF